ALNADAKLLKELTYEDALKGQLKVMDAAAFSLCMENNIPIIVANILKENTLAKILLEGEKIGTLVHAKKE
ncbi:MAG TPA: UMP kinase, partial [Thermococcus litoralis]|nr:UMP kinase [Thermococcus litoralis]